MKLTWYLLVLQQCRFWLTWPHGSHQRYRNQFENIFFAVLPAKMAKARRNKEHRAKKNKPKLNTNNIISEHNLEFDYIRTSVISISSIFFPYCPTIVLHSWLTTPEAPIAWLIWVMTVWKSHYTSHCHLQVVFVIKKQKKQEHKATR